MQFNEKSTTTKNDAFCKTHCIYDFYKSLKFILFYFICWGPFYKCRLIFSSNLSTSHFFFSFQFHFIQITIVYMMSWFSSFKITYMIGWFSSFMNGSMWVEFAVVFSCCKSCVCVIIVRNFGMINQRWTSFCGKSKTWNGLFFFRKRLGLSDLFSPKRPPPTGWLAIPLTPTPSTYLVGTYYLLLRYLWP